MTRAIWKYPIPVTDRQIVNIPAGAVILTAQMQAGELCLWALVNPEADSLPRLIRIAGTGHKLNDDITRYRYIATVQERDRPLVWHVFESIAGQS